MIIQNKLYVPAPEYTGPGVIIDITPLKKYVSDFGEREGFRVVFEIPVDRPSGGRFYVRSRIFAPSLHPRSGFHRFLRDMFARELTQEEVRAFDTESLIGKTAHLVVVHEAKNGQVYANIAACTADKSGQALVPTPGYVRIKDRPQGTEATTASSDMGATVVHVGINKGVRVSDLMPVQVEALLEKWATTVSATATAEDKRLVAALEWRKANGATDDMPF